MSLSPRPETLTIMTAPSASVGRHRGQRGDGVGALERAEDPLGAGQQLEAADRLVVGDREVARPPGLLEERVLGADARIVEAGGDRVGLGDLAVVVAENVRPRAVQDADPAARQRRGVAGGVDPVARRLDAEELHRLVGDEGVKEAHGVRAAAHAGDQRVGELPFDLLDLRARLAADHRLQLAHEQRVRVRAGDGADHVVGRADVGDPVAQRLVHRVLERRGAVLDGVDLGAEQLHPQDVQRLALDVDRAHVDLARQAEERAGGGGGDAVLAGAGLGDDARLAHPARQQQLPDAVVDLVRARVTEVLALEVDADVAFGLARHLGREARREPQRRRAADVVGEQAVQLLREGGSAEAAAQAAVSSSSEGIERLGDVTPAERAEASRNRAAERW